MEKAFDQYEVWFVTGAQLLYGGDAVVAVDAHSNEMVNGLNESGKLPVKVVYKGTANSSKEVETVFKAANNDENHFPDVDSRSAAVKETAVTPAHSVQQRNSLGYHGYGLHESESIRPWRP